MCNLLVKCKKDTLTPWDKCAQTVGEEVDSFPFHVVLHESVSRGGYDELTRKLYHNGVLVSMRQENGFSRKNGAVSVIFAKIGIS